MELKELTDKTLELFGITSPEQLGSALLAACDDPDKLYYGKKMPYSITKREISMKRSSRVPHP